MPLHFFAEAAARARPGDLVELEGMEAHHAAAARRLRSGEAVTVGDGRGVWLTGVCESVRSGSVGIRVTESRRIERARPRLVLVQALAKGDRDERAIQAATELGVDQIVPWQAARSVARWDGAKAQRGQHRWQTIVREAAKQAHRAWIPRVTDAVSTAELAPLLGPDTLVLEPRADQSLTAASLGRQRVVFVVGPEGGIDPEESAVLASFGAKPVRMGDTVLRTSTAGPAAIAVACARLGRWGGPSLDLQP